MQDEILVKGADGKWYILRGEELVPYGEGVQGPGNQVAGVKHELPKGVKVEAHEKLEQKIPVPELSSVQSAAEDRKQKTDMASEIRPPSSVLRSPAFVPPELPELAAPSLGPVTHEGHPLYKELQEIVEEVMQNVKLKMQNVDWISDEVLRKRFQAIVSARLRDVRDASETRAMLVRDVKIGGMGFSDQATAAGATRGLATEVMEIIEKAFQDFQNKWKDFEAKRIEEWKRKAHEEAARKQEEQKKKEEQEMEERYWRLTKSEIPARPAGGRNPKSEIPNQNKFSTGQEIPKSKIQISKEIPKPKAQISKPAPGMASEIRPPSSVLRPPGKVTDVRTPPKLLGPVQELQALTLQDFRRLGAPAEAISKIKAKINFLAKESFTKRREGIKAWQGSPLYRLYLFISGTSLQERKSIEQVIGDLQAQGKDTLTSDEFHAIMELNKSLRF